MNKKMTPFDADNGTILKVLVGSHIHGLNIPTSDKDINAIIIEPIEKAIGIGNPFEELIVESPEQDITYVSLRKWCRLALGGNPNFLLPLFAPESCILDANRIGRDLIGMRDNFISKAAGKSHLGYMMNQRKRMLGQLGNGGHGQQRKDLVEKFGFDTKFGMHLLRLGMQGVEFLTDGKLTLPLPEKNRTYLLEVRSGKHHMDDVIAVSLYYESKIEKLLETSSIPDKPNRDVVEAWMVKTYLNHWS